MTMGEEVVSTYLRSKMLSILEDVRADPCCPSYIKSKSFGSFEEKIKSRESSACPVLVDLLYELIEALSDCRVFSYERFTLTAKKGFFFNFLRIHYTVSEFMFNRRMINRLNAIEKKLSTSGPTTAPAGQVIEQTYPIQNHSLIIGFEEQVRQIEDRLMLMPRPCNKEEEIEEERKDMGGIGIVGEWGCGKTALAQKVFTSQMIEKEFSPRIWVCLSNIKLDDEHEHELNNILKDKEVMLEGKRYLIVLDDVWHWQLPKESLYDCLPKGSGGAVIVTSRQENVVTHMFADAKPHLIRLKPGHLTDDICWEIFSNQVQLQGKMLPNLSTIKEDVKTKSKGQPLAAKTLANILPDLLSKSYWIRARDLSILQGDDDNYWKWTSLPEEMEEVAELMLDVYRLEIKGSLELKLNEMVFKTYSAYLVFKLKDTCNLDCFRVRIVSDGKDERDQEERLVFIDHKNIQGEGGGYFPQAGGTGWMEIKLGEFSSGQGRFVEVIIENSLDDRKSGLIVKGIDFRPNSIDSNVPTSMK